MFDLGIVAVTVGIACPGARRIIIIEMKSGELGVVKRGGIIEWVPAVVPK